MFVLLIALGFLLSAAGGVYLIFQYDLSAARARISNRSKILKISSGQIEFAQSGRGHPVLVLHGAGGGFDQGLLLTRSLNQDQFHLIVPSRFGYLGSNFPQGADPAMQADAYAELLDSLGLEAVFVLAFSAGEWSALRFALRHPRRCKALVLLAPADYLPSNALDHVDPVVRRVFSSDFCAWVALKLTMMRPQSMLVRMLGTNPHLVTEGGAEERLRIQSILDCFFPISLRTQGIYFDIGTAAAGESGAVEEISCPFLAISTDDDYLKTAARAKALAQRVPGAKLVVFSTGGHVLVGRQAEVLGQITSFLCPTRSPHDSREHD